MHIPELRPQDSLEQFWIAVLDVLDVMKSDETEPSNKCEWQLYCELAGHFSRHIEALQPGQHGERVASYGWWLADKVGRLLGRNEEQAKHMLEQVVRPEARLSFARWQVARSEVVPSLLRYCSLEMSSVWAISLLAQWSQVRSSLSLEQITKQVHERIDSVLRDYLLFSPLANNYDDPTVFGFQENDAIAGLCSDVLSSKECESFVFVIEFRRNLIKSVDLLSRLEQLRDASAVDRVLTMQLLKDVVFSNANFDDSIGSWLEPMNEASQNFLQLEPSSLEPLLELLPEFHQRKLSDWGIRLPHILAHAIEQSDDEIRVERLFQSVLFMSINAGIVSPIQRLLVSKWRSKSLDLLQMWRDSAVNLARYSDPWVAGRIRGTSSAVSRLIGPRVLQESIQSSDPTT